MNPVVANLISLAVAIAAATIGFISAARIVHRRANAQRRSRVPQQAATGVFERNSQPFEGETD